MESSITGPLAGIAADEATLAAVIPEIVTAYQQKSDALAAIEAKIANGELTNLEAIAAEVSTVKASFDADLAQLEAIVPAAGPGPTPAPAPDAPTKTVYTFSSSTPGAVGDSRFTASGFEAVLAEGATGGPLFYFSGDIAAGEENGTTVTGYEAYTGPVQAVPAA